MAETQAPLHDGSPKVRRGSAPDGLPQVGLQVPQPRQPMSSPVNPEPAGQASRPGSVDPNSDLRALVDRVQAGDTDAFAGIYTRYRKTIFGFVYNRCRDYHLTEDLTSNTFLRAFMGIGRFTWQGGGVGAWLVTIARHQVADYRSFAYKRRDVPHDDMLLFDRSGSKKDDWPETAVIGHLTNLALLSAIKQLTPMQRECIVLRFLREFSVAQTASTMGLEQGAVKALQGRALKTLARTMPRDFPR